MGQAAPTDTDQTDARSETSKPESTASASQVETKHSTDSGETPVPQASKRTPAAYFYMWALAPALVAIVLAIVTRQVIPSLALGILCAAVMMCIYEGQSNPIAMVVYAMEHYVLGVFIPPSADGFEAEIAKDAAGYAKRLGDGYGHLYVILFTQFIGGMIGIIEANGGTRAMVARITHWMRTPRRGQLGAFGGGLLVFFDDYANAMILGPSMRPVFDKLRLSRAKLAYIVDSTAAPVASVFIGTWLAAEISYLDDAIGGLGGNKPAFLENVNGSAAFWNSIPYRTYAWLALFVVLIIALTGRDFGPMRRAEESARQGRDSTAIGAARSTDSNDISHWMLGFLPVLVLVVMTLTLLMITGRNTCIADGLPLAFDSMGGVIDSIKTILGQADSYKSLLYAGLTAVIVAAVSTVASRTLSLSKTMEAMTGGMQRIFGAQIVLILAWGLSGAMKDLQLGQVATGFLEQQVAAGNFSVPLLPTVIFITACIVSFSTGTSWGTMGILCPTAVAIASGLLGNMPVEQAEPLFYASIGAVLTGAVFGDHCSPISDTTVLSSITTECDLTMHVRTQLPYAALTAVVGLLCTDLLDYWLITNHAEFYHANWNVYYGTGIAMAILAALVFLVGRRPKTNDESYQTSPA